MNKFPIDYTSVIKARMEKLKKLKQSAALQKGAREYYSTRPIEFINDWAVTYDPRNAMESKPTKMPFILFDRQEDLILFIMDCINGQESGLIEKCRDVGATWVCCAFSVWMWLYIDGSSVGWGSRKEQLVDRLGDMDSIFEKIRFIIQNIPRCLWPEGFEFDTHCNFMKIINPVNGNSITGEGGDNIGRGGRKTIYFKDESAFYERAEKIEASLSENTNVQMDLSSVPEGTNNVFTRKRRAGVIWEEGKKIKTGKNRVFIFDWRDHPHKTQEWYNRKRQKAEDEGLLHIFAREVDRDPASSVDNVLIPKPWIEAAVDAHEILKFEAEGMVFGSLDIADEGKDKTALGVRKGVVVIHLDQWPDPDVGESTRRTVPILKVLKVGHFKYDSVGMGSGVKSELNRLKGKKVIPKNMIILPFNAGGKVVKPNERVIKGDKESPKNKDFYSKINAQGGWALRRRFEKTYKSVVKGEEHDVAELISLPSDLPYLSELKDELSQPTFSHKDDGKLTLIKKPKGEISPNLFDVIMMLYCPIEEKRKVLI